GADIDREKIARLKEGKSPIYEPGLDALLTSNLAAGRLSFTENLAQAIEHSDLLFIAVGTPENHEGAADLTAVESVARTIGEKMNGYKLIVNKSTVPVGTQKKVAAIIGEELKKRKLNLEFDVVSNPEFLREGVAIERSEERRVGKE